MVTYRCQVLLVALTVSLLEMGSRGFQLYEKNEPSPESLTQQILLSEIQSEPRPDTGASVDLSLMMDGSCGEAPPNHALQDTEHRDTVTPTHATDTRSPTGRFKRTASPWEAVLPGVLKQGGKSRKKRTALYWPDGTVFIAEFFFIIPIEAPTGVSIPFTIDVPYEFTLPNITTDFFKREGIGRDDRLNLYGVVERLFQRFGLDGRACVLRAVCERASSSLEGAGMLGEVITTILTASLSVASEGMYDYLVAEHNGRTRGDCWALYPSCPVSLFNWLE